MLELEDIPKPGVKPGHVLVKVAAAGICGTDHAIFAGNGPDWTNYPVVPGHEFSGTIEEVGECVSGVGPGDHVAIDNYLRCGRCWYCCNGHYFLCEEHAEVGMTINGGFAEYSLIPETNVVKIPDGLSVVDAALTEPVATALRACRSAGMRFGDEIVVLGCGPLGYLIAQISKVMGGRVTLVGRGNRLRRIRECGRGYDAVVDSSECDWPSAIRENARDSAVDVIFEATGSPDTVYASIELLRKKGRLVLMGVTWGKSSEIPLDPIVLNEIEIMGKVSGMGFFDEALDMMREGLVDPGINITHRFDLAHYADAVRYEKERIDGAIKVIITQD